MTKEYQAMTSRTKQDSKSLEYARGERIIAPYAAVKPNFGQNLSNGKKGTFWISDMTPIVPLYNGYTDFE